MRPATWGNVRTIRVLPRCRVREARLFPRRSFPQIREAERSVCVLPIEGELTASINGGTNRTVEVGSRMVVPPGASLNLYNHTQAEVVFQLLYIVEGPPTDA